MSMVKDRNEAFRVASSILQGDFEYDADRSKRAGYPIYYGVSYDEWISDLGTRLEVTDRHGKSYNLFWKVYPDITETLIKQGFKRDFRGIWVH